jgi:hydrogenase nickel incorporation protein HypA/HybF
MHEMALTQSLIELIEEESRKQGFSRVRVVRLEIGALSSVEVEVMRFCFNAVAHSGLVENALLDTVIIPGQAWCSDCAKTVTVFNRLDPCPECGRFRTRVTAGAEMRLSELEVE